MEKKNKKNSGNLKICLVIQIICSLLISAGAVYSHTREDMPYSRINELTEYVLLYNVDIYTQADNIRMYAEKLEKYIDAHIPKRKDAGGDYNN